MQDGARDMDQTLNERAGDLHVNTNEERKGAFIDVSVRHKQAAGLTSDLF